MNMRASTGRMKCTISGVIFGFVVMMASAASLRAATWEVQTVDQSGTGRYSSLKIDKDGNAHLAYIVEEGRLKYAFWDHATKKWFTMVVAEGASFSDLALDSKQHPHISFADLGTVGGTKLRHAYWDGAKWHTEAIPLNSDVIAYFTSIVVDHDDHPWISFYEYRGPRGSEIVDRMRVVSWNGKYWEVRTVDGENQSGKFNALAVDPEGQIRLVYANVNAMTASVRYAFWDGRDWQLEMVDDRAHNSSELVGFSTCIAIDEQGNPHLAYMNYSRPALKYAVRKDGKWSVQEIQALKGVGYPDRNSIALDSAGNPYIGYYDSGLGALRLAHYDQEKWTVETIDSNFAGFTSSIQIVGEVLWISYADDAGGIKVAKRELAAAVGPTAKAKQIPAEAHALGR